MQTTFVGKIGKRGTFVIPAELRERFSLKEGDVMITEASDEGLFLKPAVVLPVETYSLERKAAFILSNSISLEDYEEAKKAVVVMGLNPTAIEHYSPFKG